MKKRYFLEITMLVLAIVFISFSAQVFTLNANAADALYSDSTSLLNEESQDFANPPTNDVDVLNPEASFLLTEESQDFANPPTNDVDVLNPEASFLLTEESQDFAYLSSGIYGWVENKFTGEPVEDAKVYIRFNGETYDPVETDLNGYYERELPTPKDGELVFLVVEKHGFWSASEIRIIHTNGWARQDFKLYPYPTP